MLVLFQRRVIYLPSVPPGTRDEPVPHQTGNLEVKEVQLQSEEPSRWLRRTVNLRGIAVEWRSGKADALAGPERRVVIVYLQGNAGTPLLRLPVFRKLLKPDRSTARSRQPRITLLAVAPRSYWLSDRTTPTEHGVLADYRAALAYAQERYGSDATYVLYGHSLGGAAAVLLMLRQLDERTPHIAGLILENPLPSIPYMVRSLYPQRWLPYHYLGPFAFDKWDALPAIEQGVRQGSGVGEKRRRFPPSLWIRSGRDEIIPHGANDGVERIRVGRARWIDIPHALHDTAYMEQRWRDEIRRFVDELSSAQGRKAGS
ncbi:hypothetical protein RHOSPDRAFT_21556 [Rhodotorula sp. JG-1b]|nr:hypothetical protein RHOSPDRAFT_21556 [Rhodotorula sp. JG-1b]